MILLKKISDDAAQIASMDITPKGLAPDTPMKNSGVEWLGEVPEHWTVVKLAYRYTVMLGKMLDDKKITGNFLAPYLRNIDAFHFGPSIPSACD